jgi:hypothetical protein
MMLAGRWVFPRDEIEPTISGLLPYILPVHARAPRGTIGKRLPSYGRTHRRLQALMPGSDEAGAYAARPSLREEGTS